MTALDLAIVAAAGFPADRLPDGVILTTHHVLYGLVMTLVGCAVVWDDYSRREPLVAALAALVALMGFGLAWRLHPVSGAIAALVGTTVAAVAPIVGWSEYPRRWRAWTSAWALVALDDVVNHALGWPTPLDWLYRAHIMPYYI